MGRESRLRNVMSTSPLHYCTACRSYVELDRSQTAFAREQGCHSDACALKAFLLIAPSRTAGTRQSPSRPASLEAGGEPPIEAGV